MKRNSLFNLTLLTIMAACLPAAADVNYSFSVCTGFGPHVMIMDPYTSGYYSPFYLYNRPYYRNYLYYGGAPFLVLPPPRPLPPPVQLKPKHHPIIHPHGLKKFPK